MVAFCFLSGLEAPRLSAIMLQGIRRAQQLAPWPAKPGAALEAHAAAAAELRCGTAAALQQQLGMASEFATAQACSMPLSLPLISKSVTEPHSNACQHCCRLPSGAATCSSAMHSGRSHQTFCAATMRISNLRLGRPLRTTAWRQQPHGEAFWRTGCRPCSKRPLRRRAPTRWRRCNGSCAALQLLQTLCTATTWRLDPGPGDKPWRRCLIR